MVRTVNCKDGPYMTVPYILLAENKGPLMEFYFNTKCEIYCHREFSTLNFSFIFFMIEVSQTFHKDPFVCMEAYSKKCIIGMAKLN